MARLGWLFCEVAFIGWEAMPERAFSDGKPRWWARPFYGLLTLSFRAGCWLYGRAE